MIIAIVAKMPGKYSKKEVLVWYPPSNLSLAACDHTMQADL